VKTPARFIYSPGYYCDIGAHVFPTVKFRLIYEKLRTWPELGDEHFLEPRPITRDDLLLVHTPEYVADLLSYSHTRRTLTSELPISKQIIDSYLIGTGGTLLACRCALDGHPAMNLTGGFHHAFPDRAEGFCYVNDIAIAIRKLQGEGRIRRAAVLDCDLHQGNGNAYVFRNDETVFTFSIHQENNYPVKQQSDLDIGLDDGAGDDEYLRQLRQHVPAILSDFKPDLILYVAGADPFEDDQLGALRLTKRGLRLRDELVLGESHRRGIPLAAVVAGGYAYNTDDTVDIHINTCRVLMEVRPW